MKVAVNWSEMEHYSSVVDVDADHMRENEYDPETYDGIMRYLKDNPEAWKEQVSTADDFYGSDGAVVTNVYRAEGNHGLPGHP